MTVIPNTRGLGGLATAGQPQQNGPLDIYQRPKIQSLLALLAAHPEASAGLKEQLLQSALAPIQEQQAQAQENRGNLQGLLTNAAMQPGTTPEMLAGLASATAPNLAAKPFGQNLLQGLTSGLSMSAGVADPITGEALTSLTAEDIPLITSAVTDAYSAMTPEQHQDPAQYDALINGVRNQAIAQGKDEQAITEAIELARHVIERLDKGGGGPAYTNQAAAPLGPPTPLTGKAAVLDYGR